VASHPQQKERQLEEVVNRNSYQHALLRMHQAHYQPEPHKQLALLQVSPHPSIVVDGMRQRFAANRCCAAEHSLLRHIPSKSVPRFLLHTRHIVQCIAFSQQLQWNTSLLQAAASLIACMAGGRIGRSAKHSMSLSSLSLQTIEYLVPHACVEVCRKRSSCCITPRQQKMLSSKQHSCQVSSEVRTLGLHACWHAPPPASPSLTAPSASRHTRRLPSLLSLPKPLGLVWAWA